MFLFLNLYGDWSLLVLRLALGLIFIAHGWPKLKDLKKTSENFSGMGFKPGVFWGPLTAIVEFFGGIALVLGFWTQAAAFFLAGEFVVIMIWKLLKGQTFVGGFEFDLLILAATLVLIASGGGAFGFDSRFFSMGF